MSKFKLYISWKIFILACFVASIRATTISPQETSENSTYPQTSATDDATTETTKIASTLVNEEITANPEEFAGISTTEELNGSKIADDLTSISSTTEYEKLKIAPANSPAQPQTPKDSIAEDQTRLSSNGSASTQTVPASTSETESVTEQKATHPSVTETFPEESTLSPTESQAHGPLDEDGNSDQPQHSALIQERGVNTIIATNVTATPIVTPTSSTGNSSTLKVTTKNDLKNDSIEGKTENLPVIGSSSSLLPTSSNSTQNPPRQEQEWPSTTPQDSTTTPANDVEDNGVADEVTTDISSPENPTTQLTVSKDDDDNQGTGNNDGENSSTSMEETTIPITSTAVTVQPPVVKITTEKIPTTKLTTTITTISQRITYIPSPTSDPGASPLSIAFFAMSIILLLVAALALYLAVMIVKRRDLRWITGFLSRYRQDDGNGNNNLALHVEMGVLPPVQNTSCCATKDVYKDGFSEYLATVVKPVDASGNTGLADQFKKLAMYSPPPPAARPEDYKTALLECNKMKNRYINILPYEATRVVLTDIGNQEQDYINASYIMGASGEIEYIACQGPLLETCEDFWKMIFENDVAVIAMVTNLEEQGKTKCYKYFPDAMGRMTFDKYVVKCIQVVDFQSHTQRTFLIKEITGELQKTLLHLHFREWPDFGCPKTTDSLINFCRTIREAAEKLTQCLILVHCSAGVGRTGTLIALDILTQELETNDTVNIFETLLSLRKQRINMVQTDRQYYYIHKCVENYIKNYMGKNIALERCEMEPIYQNVQKPLADETIEIKLSKDPITPVESDLNKKNLEDWTAPKKDQPEKPAARAPPPPPPIRDILDEPGVPAAPSMHSMLQGVKLKKTETGNEPKENGVKPQEGTKKPVALSMDDLMREVKMKKAAMEKSKESKIQEAEEPLLGVQNERLTRSPTVNV